MSLIRKVDIRDEAGDAFADDNPLWVHSSGEIDSGNSSSTPLGNGGIFTGTSIESKTSLLLLLMFFLIKQVPLMALKYNKVVMVQTGIIMMPIQFLPVLERIIQLILILNI